MIPGTPRPRTPGAAAAGPVDERYAELVQDGLVTVAEAAAFLHVSRSTVYGLMEKGELCYVKLGSARRIPKRALVELAAASLRGDFREQVANWSRRDDVQSRGEGR